jgi:hypothetical protein
MLFSLTSLAQTPAVHPRVTQAVDMNNLVTLRGNVHPLARPEYDQGVAPDDLLMKRILMVLQRGAEQEASLRQFLDQQQVKTSAQFHQWLTPEQFGQQFGPAGSDLQAVTDWLTAQGFQVSKVAAGRTVIEFSGTAGLVRQVLGTEIHKFRVNSGDYWANVSDPQIPAALAPVVTGFDSLNNFPRKPLHENLGTFSRSKATGEVKPLFSVPTSCAGGSGTCYDLALGPTDFATIYNVAPLWSAGTTGTGQTIAVVGQTNINIQDVRDFRTMFGLPANDPNIILDGPDPGITATDETEADLDVEWSGAVAEGATIDLVVSESTETTAGIDLSALYIIDNNLASVMSISYGDCEAEGAATNAFHSTLWEQAAAEGITVVAGSGDSGSAGCDTSPELVAQYGLAVSGLASTPFDVAVGGTDFNDLSSFSTYWNQTNAPTYENSAKSYIPEMPWNNSCGSSGVLTGCASASSTDLSSGLELSAGGGGPSSCANPSGTFPSVTCPGGGYAKPAWQSGTGVPSDGVRDTPDISLFAGDGYNGTFYVICQMDANAAKGGSSSSCDLNLNTPYEDFQGVGGTSASTQAFAGIMALVNQAHGRQGNANYVLYPLAAQAGNTCVSNTAAVTNASCIFYDIDNATGSTTVNSGISVACQGGTPNCSNTSTAANQYGIMVSGSPAAAAYSTTTGYDLATGLGSVNAANLVNHWASNFTTSTISLQLSTNPATNPVTQVHGQPVNFSISVTGAGTPSGDVSLIAQTGAASNNTTGIGPFRLINGNVSGSTIMLPGSPSPYNVTAHYAGNGKFGASDSTPGVPVTISKENSATEVRLVTSDPASGQSTYFSSATSVSYGSPYVLRMDVTNHSGNLCANTVTEVVSYACPTGNLTVSPAPTDVNAPADDNPGHYTLNTQGYAEDEPIQQSPGLYNFVATYAGDNSYNGSTSSTLPVTVTAAQTTTTISGVPASGVAGAQITVTAVVSTESNGAAPTGTIQLLNNGSPLGNAVVVSGIAGSAGNSTSAMAQATVTATLPSGGASISAKYSGDTNYAPSNSAATSVATSDFGLSANPSPVTISAPGQTGNTTISVSPQDGFTGTVNLSVASGCPTGATCTLSPPSVTISGASAATSTLSITTTGGSSTPAGRRRVPPSLRLPAGLLPLIAGLLALVALLSSPALRRRPAVVLFAAMLLVVGVWAACGGGGGGGGNPTPTPVPGVGLSTTNLAFTSQNMGTTSAAQNVNLTDTGTGALTINNIKTTGANSGDFSETNTCGSSVAAGANCSISVTFAPTGTGVRTASVSITDNANGSPQSVSLTGTGAQALPPTPAGAYSVTVNAVSGGDSHSIVVNVNVQ